MQAEYALNKQRQLYYVYALVSKEDNKAKDLVWKLRENPDFSDAWLFRGRLVTNNGIPELMKVDLPSATANTTTTASRSISDIAANQKDTQSRNETINDNKASSAIAESSNNKSRL